MKVRFLVFSLFITTFFSEVLAQDIITFTNADEVEAIIKEINENEIIYKKYSNPNGPIYKVNKDNVFFIKYENGEKEIFSSIQNVKNQVRSDLSQDSRNDSINKIYTNQWLLENDVKYIGEPNADSKAPLLYCLFRPTSASALADNNISISFLPERVSPFYQKGNNLNSTTPGCAIVVVVHNNTDKTIYLDMGNSFYSQNKIISVYFTPSSTSISSSSSTYSYGIFGLGSSSSGISTTYFSQKILTLPAHGFVALKKQPLFPENTSEIYRSDLRTVTMGTGLGTLLYWNFPKEQSVKQGEIRVFEENESPIHIGFEISYSFKESMENANVIKFSLYTWKIIGCQQHLKAQVYLKKGQLEEKFRQLPGFVCIQENKKK